MKYIKTFSELGLSDLAIVGGKNASLGEMYSVLTAIDTANNTIRVPNGFATTAEAYWLFLDHNKFRKPISAILDKLDTHDVNQLAESGKKIRDLIMHGTLPPQLTKEIEQAYATLSDEYGQLTDVAVRSSATAEDLPNASFAGQQETYLNIRGVDNLLNTCRRVYASLFTDRAISYRVHQGFSHMDVALSIGIQKMVRADIGSAGVMFTLDTETGFRDVVFINSAYGLGETVVQGSVNPDEFYVFKTTFNSGNRPIIKRQLGDKAIKMIYASDNAAGLSTRSVHVHQHDRDKFSINDDDVLELARYAMQIEAHYTKLHNKPMPMDIEWAKDGVDHKLYILQARPETVQSQVASGFNEVYKLARRGKILSEGKSIGKKIASGKARVILEAAFMHELQPGEVLVTDITDPDWEPIMKIAAGIVTNRGGRTCHAAIIARELGIPAVVGCGHATHEIHNDETVTISCAEGDTGFIYSGALSFSVEQLDFDLSKKPDTKLMLNLANPELAFETSMLPSEGVGLARLEFIINTMIRIHPQALLSYDSLDPTLQVEIDFVTRGYADKRSYYINKLAEGIGTIAAAFYPRTVIVRFSDFKSNEYASLMGGLQFEPKEENPMIGFRGASRYPSKDFSACFAMECDAIKQVRNTMGLNNVSVMIPFVRSLDEAQNVLSIMSTNGLKRGVDGLNIYLMCELPVNALLADQFLALFDGFSIGSNDLTQLTLGVDRDSGLLQGYDERNDAVKALMKMAIDACKKQNKYIGICGQAPSDFPEITTWLVQQGIGSISLNPDSIMPMYSVVLQAESQNR